jgi:hypothetical protein
MSNNRLLPRPDVGEVKDACPFIGVQPFAEMKKSSILSGGKPELEQGLLYPECIREGCKFWHPKHECVIRAGLLALIEARA